MKNNTNPQSWLAADWRCGHCTQCPYIFYNSYFTITFTMLFSIETR